ncbi:MAG: response regulator, partial [Coleofasciculaceae cyanobacterium]
MNQEPNTKHQANILIVDDTSVNLDWLSILLSDFGYKVQLVLNGAKALVSIQNNLPDLILLDTLMPDMNGYQVYEQLKSNQQTADIPVIFISALDTTSEQVKSLMKYGVDYITKPFEKAEILARIENQLSIRRLNKQLIEEKAKLQQEIRISQDIIKQHQIAEAEIIRSRDLLESVFNGSADAIF